MKMVNAIPVGAVHWPRLLSAAATIAVLVLLSGITAIAASCGGAQPASPREIARSGERSVASHIAVDGDRAPCSLCERGACLGYAAALVAPPPDAVAQPNTSHPAVSSVAAPLLPSPAQLPRIPAPTASFDPRGPPSVG